ncbi:protein arginine N-methyltransferase 9-like [Tribolium madens]|uniref:protein arginine N-methyltransferase 9-like n=1 Tax=Tribolium madens TaxID=41895 RepID=UPI001CF764C4|nr:protein arginine N-methyltransferase 9-like [Tribolium madens]
MDTDERVPRVGEIKILVRPEYYLAKVRQELANGNKVGAIEQYLNYIDNLRTPHDMQLVEQINLTKLIMSLSSNVVEQVAGVDNEIIKCYLTMLNSFPNNAILLNAFGVYFFSQGEYTVARCYLQKAAAEGYLPAEKNFLHVIWHLIPRWHFRMLNDQQRNEFFRDAIHKALDSGFKNVYDIGCGCGLLSLISASHRKDVRVTGMEENKILCDIAQNLCKARGYENVNIIHCNSNTVTAPPAPCNLVVTEIFDAAVFGEDCLKTIHYALEHFVSKKFRIIPASAKLYVTAFESHELTRKFRYTESLRELNLENICLVEIDPEPYDAEYLNKRPIKYMSDTKTFLEVNFYNKKQLSALLTPDSDCINEIELVCTEKGTIHALAIWFDLRLDEEITISTNPFNSNVKCWEQGVVHLDHPIEVASGDILRLKPRIVEGQIHFDVLSHDNPCEQCFEVSKEIISFLNDTKLVQTVIKAADSYENCDVRVIDFNVFPLFGFLMAKKGATVYHVYNDESDLSLFNHVMSLNQLSNYKFIFIYHRAVEDYMVFLEPPNIVFFDLVKTDGSWNKQEFSLETEAKLNCESLPKKVFLYAQLISSNYLTICNKVDDNKALNFNIADKINDFSGNEHPNLESLEHEKHSSVVSFDISDMYKFDFHMEADVIKDGSCNGILYWFDIQFTDDENNVFNTLNSTHYDRACTLLLNNPKIVKTGEKVMIHIMRLEGYLKLYCD